MCDQYVGEISLTRDSDESVLWLSQLLITLYALSYCDVAIPLRFRQTFAPISYYLFLTIYFLGKYCPVTCMTGILVYDKLFVGMRVGKDWRECKSCFQLVEEILALFCP